MKKFKLMIKTHSITNLKYLCITSKENWVEYPGSGSYWKKHLDKHGYTFSTELIFCCDDYEIFKYVCIEYSNILNVVESSIFANQIPESGYGEHDRPNVVVWWDFASQEQKDDVFARRAKSLSNNGNHWAHNTTLTVDVVSKIKNSLIQFYSSEYGKSIRNKITESLIQFYSELSDEEKISRMQPLWNGRDLFYSDKNSEKYKSWKEKQYENLINRWRSITDIELHQFKSNVSAGRCNMTQESKKIRADRVRESFLLSPSRISFNERQKTERLGTGNPMARVVIWFGQEFTMQDFKKFKKENSITTKMVEHMCSTRDDCFFPEKKNIGRIYEILTCPYCNKNSNGSHSGFRRWHFDNCKFKETV
jgi:hypothetical protein